MAVLLPVLFNISTVLLKCFLCTAQPYKFSFASFVCAFVLMRGVGLCRVSGVGCRVSDVRQMSDVSWI